MLKMMTQFEPCPLATHLQRPILMEMMRSAIIFTSCRHVSSNFGLPRISATILAPWMGGLEYIARTRILSCDSIRLTSSTDWETKENAPTLSPYSPKFLAND